MNRTRHRSNAVFSARARLAALLVTALAGLVLAACGLAGASEDELAQAEAAWQAAPLASYHVVVEVQRPQERRRHEVWVQDGEIVSGTLQYGQDGQGWGPPQPVETAQAAPFTVPGLFATVREQMRYANRLFVRVQLSDTPPFPRRIVLGPVRQDGMPVEGTETTVDVRLLEPLPPP
ncbi:MAG: hypothetical protein KatS3mg050_0869 [Litorilinea sp.]|nr:MAG: hypothetical protein KatS3mg050_0869 [Litorilinea sp.]